MSKQTPGQRLDLNADHTFLGPVDEFGHKWAYQDGIIFHWSESNVGYESAWWLNTDGSPAEGETMGQQKMMDAINRRSPFNPDWLP
jgi:hypothetical protein